MLTSSPDSILNHIQTRLGIPIRFPRNRKRSSINGNLAVIAALLDAGADVNAIDTQKKTALFFAKGNSRREVAELLVARGAIDTKDGRLTKTDLIRAQKSSLTRGAATDGRVSLRQHARLLGQA